MIFTIGHSKLEPTVFAQKLHDHNVETVIDVRSHPTSRWEQFQHDQLQDWLPNSQAIDYLWLPSLGGWTMRHAGLAPRFAPHGVDVLAYSRGAFPKQRIAATSLDVDTGWTNQGLHDYAWYTTLNEFQKGLGWLVKLGGREKVAIMCAETLWWKCHRSMIADVLWATYDEAAYHILGNDAKPHPIGNRLDRYNAQIRATWKETV